MTIADLQAHTALRIVTRELVDWLFSMHYRLHHLTMIINYALQQVGILVSNMDSQDFITVLGPLK